jgi:putative nucleotidyltransferase with HDIG domain
MTVPDRAQAAGLLLSLDPPDWAVRHARAVAEVAAWLAERVRRQGMAVDRRLVDVAALLHDVDKILPPTDPVKDEGHGAGSAAWLARVGHPELGPIVRDHPVTRLAEPGALEGLLRARVEARIVAYADKRAGQRLTSVDERFAHWNRRYPRSSIDGTELRARVDALEADVCRLAGVRPADVGRLRWTGPAFRTARTAIR